MKLWASVFAIACILSWVGNMGYDDEIADQEYYRLMTCAGIWPDYRELNLECPKIQPQEF